jgi:hypothetical protein
MRIVGRASTAVGIAVACALVTIFLHELVRHPTYRPAWGDQIYFHFLWNAGRVIWREYGQPPFWNPYQCGGMVELANVHSMAWSPFFVPGVLLGSALGIAIFIWLHVLIAFVGAWLWARARGLEAPWSFAPAITFAMGGFFAARAVGHLSFLPFAWVPWLLLLYERAERAPRFGFVIGALIALCLYTGAPYPTTFCIFLVGALVARDLVAVPVRRLRGDPTIPLTRPLAIALLAALGFVLVGALKLFPTIEYVQAHPRAIPAGDEALGPGAVVDMLLYRPFTRERDGYAFPFDEYRQYVGPLVVLGALLTVLHGRVRGRDAALVAILLAFVAGDHGPRSPYALLHQLPGFASQRVPARFMILVVPFLGLWFGRALADVAGRGGPASRWRCGLAGAALVATFADLFLANTVPLHGMFTVPSDVATPRAGSPPYVHIGTTDAETVSRYVRAPLEGYDFVRCDVFEPNPPAVATELRAVAADAVDAFPNRFNQARVVRFTPNVVEVEAEFTKAGSIVLNENYYQGWASDFGPANERGGRPEFKIPAGTRTVTLRYQPRYVEIYATMTAVGLMWLAITLLKRGEPSS